MEIIFLYNYLNCSFIATSYLWIIGSVLSITTEDLNVCYDLDKNHIEIILYGNAIFFAAGILFFVKNEPFHNSFLKLYNRGFIVFSFVLAMIGIIRFFKSLNSTTICSNIKLVNNFLTLSYSIIFGIFFSYIFFFCFLEILYRSYYIFKCFSYSFCNCCCYFNCFSIGRESYKFVYVAPKKTINFLQYIKPLFGNGFSKSEMNLNVIHDNSVLKNNQNNQNASALGLTEAEQKKIIFSL